MNEITDISTKVINKTIPLKKYNRLLENKIIAMVPVRAGSTRVPNKNIRKFGDTSLLELKLKVLKKVEDIAEIVVSTDCKIAADIAHKQNVKVQLRNKYYAGSEVTNDQHWLHIAQTTPGDVVLLAQVTSPLLRVSSIQSALNTFMNSNTHDSLNSVSVEKKFLWKGMKPINYDINVTPKSQDLPNIVSLNFAITIIQKQIMVKRKNVIGYNPSFFELDKVESLDIDDLIDFKIAELMYQERGIKWLMN
jgi:CMP-N,N'-diacetyllegionaminic acid synthase